MDKPQLNEMNLSFDPKADVLYCSFGEPREALSVEMDDGVVLRLNPDTDEVVGFTVVDFLKRSMKAHTISLPMGKQSALVSR